MCFVELPFDNFLRAVSRVHFFYPFWVHFDDFSLVSSHFEVTRGRPVLFLCSLTSSLFCSLCHAVELNKQISCTLQLTNKTDKQVAFKVNESFLSIFGHKKLCKTKWYRRA